jgi:hypothetical protein
LRRMISAATVALLALAVAATGALAHGGGSPDYISEVRSVDPKTGLTVTVLERDDRLLLRNGGDETVVVLGYDGEPYVRLAPDGTVSVNRNSPARYLNEDRFADVDLPENADGDAGPDWEVVNRDGQYEWHDHRIHWMSDAALPPAVTDTARETKVFDWTVPLRAGGRDGAVAGTLTWVGRPGGGFPVVAGVALAVVLIGGIVLVVVVRRRRRRGGGGGGAAGSKPAAEAW